MKLVGRNRLDEFASLLGGGVTIFNVKGKDYRLETMIAYRTDTVMVR